ncbi:MAG: nucleotidyltransferase family protein [Acidobacteriota bacterium]
MISAILLAAGESRRMGEFKQLLPFGEKTFVESCVDNLLASSIDELIVVTGHREADVRRALAKRPIKSVFNAQHRQGMSSSIQCGVEAASQNATAYLIALVDQPQINIAIINQLIEAYQQTDALIAIPVYQESRGHPILLSAKLKKEILSITPEIGLKAVITAHRNETLYVKVTDQGVLLDFDYPEDFERIKR